MRTDFEDKSSFFMPPAVETYVEWEQTEIFTQMRKAVMRTDFEDKSSFFMPPAVETYGKAKKRQFRAKYESM